MILVAATQVGCCPCCPHVRRNQEAAFWLLAELVEDILQPDTYNSNLVGCLVRSSSAPPAAASPARLRAPCNSFSCRSRACADLCICCPSCMQVEMKALDELIAQKLPRLSAHLTALEADVSILATDWLLTLFSASMPSETVSAGGGRMQTQHGVHGNSSLRMQVAASEQRWWVGAGGAQVARVWDALFAEGSKILFRTALAVLKAQEEALLAFDNAGEHACLVVLLLG